MEGRLSLSGPWKRKFEKEKKRRNERRKKERKKGRYGGPAWSLRNSLMRRKKGEKI